MNETYISTNMPRPDSASSIIRAIIDGPNLDRVAWPKTNPYFAGKNTIKNVIFNPPATIVFWNDGTKTVVKCQNDEHFDAEKGLAMAIAKKHFGNKGSYCNQIKKWTEKYEKENRDLWGPVRAMMRRIIRDENHTKIERAYKVLVDVLHKKRPRKDDLTAAMEEAIGYLGEVLDD